jgi:hypothetical protein
MKIVVGVLSLVFVVAIIGLGIFIFAPHAPAPLPAVQTTAPAPADSTGSLATGYPMGDINRDNKVDFADQQLIKSSIGCQKSNPCWTKVVGKTLDGDNPIYASDLDLNGDGIISAIDLTVR